MPAAAHQSPPSLLPPPPAALADGASLFLDFDGTLVEIADRPDAVQVDDRLRALVAALARALDGRLAIISGRSVDEIVAYLHAAAPGTSGSAPGYAIAGSHGLDLLRADGRRERPPVPAALGETLAEIRELALLTPGLMVEEKPFGIALHYRQVPEAEATVAAMAAAIARRGVFTLQHGKMVCELRAAGADKGDAMAMLLGEPPMAGTRPLFVGDDLTDEAGFRAARAAGGAGILIGERSDTMADYALPDVPALRSWLETIVGIVA